RAHPSLHPFPTRRSSDLAISVNERQFDTTATAAPIVDSAGRILGSLGLSGATAELRDVESSALPSDVRRAAQAIGSRGAANVRRDRKSTRLNSSHVKISY